MPTESTPRSSLLVYGALAAVWLLVTGWLALEHAQTKALARKALLNRARDITNTIGLVSRAGPPGVIRQSRLEAVLKELTETTELRSVALLNAEGEIVATAGDPFREDIKRLPSQGTQWDRDTVTIVNLVDFGQSERSDGTTRPPTVVIPREADEEAWRYRRSRDDRATTSSLPRPDRPGPPDGDPNRRLGDDSDFPPPPPGMPDGDMPPPPGSLRSVDAQVTPSASSDRAETRSENPPAAASSTEGPSRETVETRRPGEGEFGPRPDAESGARSEGEPPGPRPEGERSSSRRFFHRPYWMDPAHYEGLLAKRGLHGFVLVMSTVNMRGELQRDLWLRLVVSVAALIAVAGVGVGWRGLVKSTQLQIRLVRAQEMNERLREMNLAAAGLAHEARNPLNIVRGVAQIIEKHAEVPATVRKQATQITDEVDRVTQRLNEFIKYSKPAQPRVAPTPLAAVVAEVFGALQTDLEDKNVKVESRVRDRSVLADESLLRQVVFNLVLNAVQAVGDGGRVVVSIESARRGEAVLSVEDNGPGVPADLREQVFRPYFTTREQGSGLGLAVVRQIVLAHHWGIECTTSDLGGAAFRIAGVKTLDGEDKTPA